MELIIYIDSSTDKSFKVTLPAYRMGQTLPFSAINVIPNVFPALTRVRV